MRLAIDSGNAAVRAQSIGSTLLVAHPPCSLLAITESLSRSLRGATVIKKRNMVVLLGIESRRTPRPSRCLISVIHQLLVVRNFDYLEER